MSIEKMEEMQELNADDEKGIPTCTTKPLVDSNSNPSSEDKLQSEENGNNAEFFLSLFGFTLGMGSIWRFPVICSRNGGGVFLIPFTFILMTAGGPLYYLEVCLGQFTGKGTVKAFEYCPLFKGLGLSQVVVSALTQGYLVMIMTWTLYFFYSCFSAFPDLPWSTCNNWWNTPHCQGLIDQGPKESANDTINNTLLNNGTGCSELANGGAITKNISLSAVEFWEYNVIRRSSGIDNMGQVQYHLLICLFLSWLLIVLASIKGLKSLGKVAYVSAVMPFLLLSILLVRGLTLDGAVDGISFFLTPDFSKLLDFQVWFEAAIQVFYSLGPAWGGVINMASKNKFHQKSFQATMLCVSTVGFTSFYSGLVVFNTLGYIAKQSGTTVISAASSLGYGLVFVAFPTALSKMPLAQFMAASFFMTLTSICCCSMCGLFETVNTAMLDLFPRQLRKKRLMTIIMNGLLFCVSGVPLTMNGGIYMFQLSDWYYTQFALMFILGLEAVSICCIYGADRFSRDIALMTGRNVSVLMRVCWIVICPSLLLTRCGVMLSQYSTRTPGGEDGYVYSTSTTVGSVIVGMLPIIVLQGTIGWQILRTHGTLKERIQRLLRPSSKWAPSDPCTAETYQEDQPPEETSFGRRLLVNIRGGETTPFV